MTVEPHESDDPRSGFVVLVGWTNVGKSSLLNALVGTKLAAVADVAQTTRARITGAYTDPRGQIVFVDTPGLHRPRHRMNREMVQRTLQALAGVDLAVLVLDASQHLGAGDREAADLVVERAPANIVVLNKVDLVRPKESLLPLMQEIAGRWGFQDVVPVSARSGNGCPELLDLLFRRLPQAEPPFDGDYLTDQTERALAAEWIREKLLERTRQELPHATAVAIERWEERPDGLVEIHASILVERESQKRIVIGHQGQLLKAIGSAARPEIEELLERRVFLSLWVRVRSGWRDDPDQLAELGLANRD